VQEILDSARRLAIAGSRDSGRERLSPPFTAVLDEIASICPLPDLPDTLSDSAGRGVLIHYALQSPAQAQARWGKSAATLFDNTTALTILGGLKSEETLKWASLLAGRRLEERRSRQLGRGFTDPGSIHIGSERVEILEPAGVRQIPRGRALLIMRSMPAVIVHLKPAWKRRDWATLQADANELRASRSQPGLPPPRAGRPAVLDPSTTALR
jgi:type IV secretory pathway TraG/TraD family ATPase VirD4